LNRWSWFRGQNETDLPGSKKDILFHTFPGMTLDEIELHGSPKSISFFSDLGLCILSFDHRGLVQTSGSKETKVIFTTLDLANPPWCAQTGLSRGGHIIRDP
jgi:hypothetical protein